MSAGEVIILDLPVIAKILLIFSMVFGRLEVLALLALLNPKIYR
jgi:trk system potassium uptake protein TrkH